MFLKPVFYQETRNSVLLKLKYSRAKLKYLVKLVVFKNTRWHGLNKDQGSKLVISGLWHFILLYIISIRLMMMLFLNTCEA